MKNVLFFNLSCDFFFSSVRKYRELLSPDVGVNVGMGYNSVYVHVSLMHWQGEVSCTWTGFA